MKNLMKALVLCTLSCTLSFIACSNDKSTCTAPAIEENIIGKWEMSNGKEVEFLADGTLIDEEDALIGLGALPFYDQKSYEVNNINLIVKTTDSGGNNISSHQYEMESNECNEIIISFLRVESILTRK